MLNIKELEAKFDAFLEKQTKEDLLKWYEFAEQRELSEKLSNGEKVTIAYSTPNIIDVDKILFSGLPYSEITAGNDSYAMAA